MRVIIIRCNGSGVVQGILSCVSGEVDGSLRKMWRAFVWGSDSVKQRSPIGQIRSGGESAFWVSSAGYAHVLLWLLCVFVIAEDCREVRAVRAAATANV